MARKSRKKEPESTGFPVPHEEHVQDRRYSPWITDELLQETRKVWSRMYARTITVNEAVEILENVKRLGEVLLEGELRRRGL